MNEKRRKAIEHEANKSTGGGGKYDYVDRSALERLGIDQWKPESGSNYIRIISPPDLTQFYGREIFKHTEVGADGSTYLCLKKMFGEPCPVCEYRDELKAGGADEDVVKALNWGRQYLFFIFNVKNSTTEQDGLHWFTCPVTIRNEIMTRSHDDRTGENLDVSDPKQGRDIKFTKEGQGLNTKYIGVELIDKNPIPGAWLDGVPNFNEILLKPSYDEVYAAVRGSVAKKVETRQAAPARETSTPPMRETVDETREASTPPPAVSARQSNTPSTPPTRESATTVSAEDNVRQKIEEIQRRKANTDG